MGEAAYQGAAACRERLQGRSLSVEAPDRPADPIIVHPGVRRSLMTMRSYNRQARARFVDGAEVGHRHRSPTMGIARRPTTRSAWPRSSGRAHRQGLRARGDGAAGVRRPRLYRGAGEPVRARCRIAMIYEAPAASGARPRRPQAADAWRPRVQPSSKEVGEFYEENRADENGALHQGAEEGAE